MDDALRQHITRVLGTEYVRMAEELGFAFGVRESPGFPAFLDLYCVCVHCRREWKQTVHRHEWDTIRDPRWLLAEFFRQINRECEIPYLPPVPVVLQRV